ncbi:MAG: folylpolyglutamate synthase/dihydrofolate synthase family protein [Anaerolineaceae bacterium]
MENLEQEYQESLDFIYSFIDFSMKRHLDDSHRFFKLDRMRRMMDLLGNPQDKFLSIHVAGTKGKGSTASLCASALRAAGYKVGLYTSPHLQEFTERIQINGKQIERQALVDLIARIRPLTREVPEITTFELMTALAFQHFHECQVNIAVVEVGLGGRLDATNIITPLVSVITPISYDHTAILGSTLTEIAYEKGGIIKPGVPAVISPQQPEAEQELARIAAERQAPLTRVEQDYRLRILSHSLRGQELAITARDKSTAYPSSLTNPEVKLHLPLLGAHQAQNALTALGALEQARARGLTLSREDIRKGFGQVEWPARFEILRENPPVVIDSAHNGDSMNRLRQSLDDYFPGQKFLLVFGASADKELDAMLSAILPRVERVITTLSTHPRAADPLQLLERIRPYGLPVEALSPAEDALTRALELAGTDCGIIVAGSIFIAAAARDIWFSSRSGAV